MYERKLERGFRCPLEYVFEVFGGKWSTKVFCLIVKEGPVRYTDFRSHLNGISDPVLSSTLKLLISHGIIERTSYNEVPMRVEYSLTQKGHSAIPVLEGLCRWASLYDPDTDGGKTIPLHCNSCDLRR